MTADDNSGSAKSGVLSKRLVIDFFILALALLALAFVVNDRILSRPKPKTAQDFYYLAKFLDEKGELEKAVAANTRSIELDPKFGKARMNMACLLIVRGEYAAGIDQYLKARQYLGDDPINHQILTYDLAGAYYREGRYEEAWNEFVEAYKLNPDRAAPGRPWIADDPRSLEYHVVKNDKAGFMKLAEKDLENYRRGRLLSEVNDRYNQLKTSLRPTAARMKEFRSIDIKNGASRYQYAYRGLYAHALYLQGRHEDAMKVLKKMERDFLPEWMYEWHLMTKVRVLTKMGRPGKAIGILQLALRSGDDRVQSYDLLFKIAEIFRYEGMFAQEQEVLRQMLVRWPKDEGVLEQLSSSYLFSGKYGEALVLSAKLLTWKMLLQTLFGVLLILGLLFGLFSGFSRIFFAKKRQENDKAPVYRSWDAFLYGLASALVPLFTGLIALQWVVAFPALAANVSPVVLGALVGEIMCAGLLYFLMRKKYKFGLEEFGLRELPLKRILGWAVVLVLAHLFIFIAWDVILKWMGDPDTDHSTWSYVYEGLKQAGHPAALLSFWIVLSLWTAVFEEMVFRVYIYQYAERYSSAGWAVFISAILFAAGHEPFTMFPAFFMFGVMQSLVFIKTRSIYPCIAAHGLWNYIITQLG